MGVYFNELTNLAIPTEEGELNACLPDGSESSEKPSDAGRDLRWR